MAGVSVASMFTLEAAGWMRWSRASKSRPGPLAITISPSTTQRGGSWALAASTISGK